MAARRALLPIGILIAVLAGLGGAAAQPDGQQQPGIFPPPEPLRVVSLAVGCNNIALTYPDGTPVNVVVGSIQPSGALYAIWRLNMTPVLPGQPGPAFEGFAPAAPQASDLQGVNFLEAVFLCVSVPSTVTMPAVQPWPYPIPLPQSTPGSGAP